MPRLIRLFLVLACLSLAAGPDSAADGALDPAKQWAQWRGPLGNGVAPHGDPPLEWSETKNVRWKVPIPGRGLSTPVIWGDRLFLTTAVPYGEEVPHDDVVHDDGAHDTVPPTRQNHFRVMALDRRNGTLLWERDVKSARPHEGTHSTGSWASASAVTDGTHVWAFFGSQGLYCLSADKGGLVWQKDLGKMQTRHEHGEGSSPVLHGDTLVINWDHQGDSFIVALDKRTGDERWRRSRDEITSWATPLVVEHGKRAQVVVPATNRVRAYDLKSGETIWEASGLSRNVVASPVAADGMVFVGNSYDWQALLAIRLEGAQGDITQTDRVAWKWDRLTPYVPSPVLDDGVLCFLRHNQGILSCVDAPTGEPIFPPARLSGVRNIFASPVVAAGRIYIVDLAGRAVVVKRGAPFEVLATNALDDSFSASPAVVGDALYLRGEQHLYGLAAVPDAKPAP